MTINQYYTRLITVRERSRALNGNTEILSFNFVAKLGETPPLRDLKPNDLFVVSSYQE
jgi:hypothetical protein